MIRPARPEDAPAIAAIWNRIIRDTVATFTTAKKDPAVLAEGMQTQPYWVAEEAGEILGFATYFQFRGGPGYPIRWNIPSTSTRERKAGAWVVH